MKVKPAIQILALAMLCVSGYGQTASHDQAADHKPNQSVKLMVNGYVRDLGCVIDCARMCARAGSPLVIITKEGTIYSPISS
jgi:hypothetical protein